MMATTPTALVERSQGNPVLTGINYWLAKLKCHDLLTYEHSLRVGTLAAKLAKHTELERDVMHEMGALHDIGKLCIDSELLNLPEITPEQYARIKTHSRNGYELLEPTLPYAAYAAGQHHPGYALNKLPPALRNEDRRALDNAIVIITLCDFYDALMRRTNHAYGHVDKTNTTEVRNMLITEFPAQQEVIDLLVR